MLLGLIVQRCGKDFKVYSSVGDFVLAVSQCDPDYNVGKWLGLRVEGREILDHGLALLPDLPEVRIRNGMAEVLTRATIQESQEKIALCETAEFDVIPLLCPLPNNVDSYCVFQVWARRLTGVEKQRFGGYKWAAIEYVNEKQRSFPPKDVIEDKEVAGISWEQENKQMYLEGLITGASKTGAYVWSRWNHKSFEGVLQFGSPKDAAVFKLGQWIHFHLSKIELQSVGCGAKFNIHASACKLIKAKFPTHISESSVKLTLKLSVPVTHVSGTDIYQEDIGVLSDPERLLNGGQDYDATIVKVRPKPSSIESQAVEWKIVCANPEGESWAPHFSRKVTKVKRPLFSGVAKTRPLQRSPTQSSSKAAPTQTPEKVPDKKDDVVDDPTRVVPKQLDFTERQRIVALAMVEQVAEKGRYRVWLLEYHREAVFNTTRILEPGHFFQGVFKLGGGSKDKCHDYIQPIPPILDGKLTEDGEIEVYVSVWHTNRKNGAHYVVYHDCLGCVEDTCDLLKQVEDKTRVSIAARRKPTANDNRLIWQIVQVVESALSRGS
ncbi:unnamed protein product [Cylicocyclus nassatus]|uniref:Uncharacterized protein n=1 Tax=Cylicocyclus nassatus TaxID=53992 RepID=A0AA36M9N1_CYLNA|nr:unnamed protein product [Cylicocyclus nassatus]